MRTRREIKKKSTENKTNNRGFEFTIGFGGESVVVCLQMEL